MCTRSHRETMARDTLPGTVLPPAPIPGTPGNCRESAVRAPWNPGAQVSGTQALLLVLVLLLVPLHLAGTAESAAGGFPRQEAQSNSSLEASSS